MSGASNLNATDSGANTVTIRPITLEQPPTQQNGGGFNSPISATTIALSTPLLAKDSINVEFNLDGHSGGAFSFLVNVR